MRLIDAGEAIRKIMDEMQKLLEQQSQFAGKSTGMVNNIQNTRYGLAKAVDILHEQPTIEERKKGTWIPHKELSREYIGSALVSIRYDYWYCDCCGYKVENGQPTYNYCPNCGARMRGGDDDTR